MQRSVGENGEPWFEQTPALHNAYWTSERLEIAEWVHRYARSLAELYRGAVELVCGPHVPGRVTLISHAVREICNRLPDAVSRIEGDGRLDYVHPMERIAEEWERAGLGYEASVPVGRELAAASPSAATTTDVSIPSHIYVLIARLVGAHKRARAKPMGTARRLYKSVLPEGEEPTPALLKQWNDVREWFVGNTHDNGRVDAEVDFSGLQQQFALFERSLLALAREDRRDFYRNMDEIDAFLEDANR